MVDNTTKIPLSDVSTVPQSDSPVPASSPSAGQSVQTPANEPLPATPQNPLEKDIPSEPPPAPMEPTSTPVTLENKRHETPDADLPKTTSPHPSDSFVIPPKAVFIPPIQEKIPEPSTQPPASVNPSKPIRNKRVGTGVLLAVILLLLTTMPLAIYYVSNQKQQLADVRSKAAGTGHCEQKSDSGICENYDCVEHLSQSGCPNSCCTWVPAPPPPTTPPPTTPPPTTGSLTPTNESGSCSPIDPNDAYDQTTCRGVSSKWACCQNSNHCNWSPIGCTPTPASDCITAYNSGKYCQADNETGDAFCGGQGNRYLCHHLAGEYAWQKVPNCDCSFTPQTSRLNNGVCLTYQSCNPGDRCSLNPDPSCQGGSSTPTPSSPPPPGQCVAIHVFDKDGNNITSALTNGTKTLNIGDEVKLCTPKGNATKAHFRIQGKTEFAENDPSQSTATEYCLKITIPSTITQSQATFEAEVWINGGWN